MVPLLKVAFHNNIGILAMSFDNHCAVAIAFLALLPTTFHHLHHFFWAILPHSSLLKCCFPFSECHLTRKALTRPALGANLMKRDLDWPNLIPFMKHCSLVLTADWPGQLEPKLCPTILLATRRPRPQKNPKRTWLSLFWTHFGLWLLPSFNKEPTYSQGDYGFQNTV